MCGVRKTVDKVTSDKPNLFNETRCLTSACLYGLTGPVIDYTLLQILFWLAKFGATVKITSPQVKLCEIEGLVKISLSLLNTPSPNPKPHEFQFMVFSRRSSSRGTKNANCQPQ